MNREQAHLQYVLIMAAANHYHRWKNDEQDYYRKHEGFAEVYQDFGTYEAHLENDLKKAREAIAKVEDAILSNEGLIDI